MLLIVAPSGHCRANKAQSLTFCGNTVPSKAGGVAADNQSLQRTVPPGKRFAGPEARVCRPGR